MRTGIVVHLESRDATRQSETLTQPAQTEVTAKPVANRYDLSESEVRVLFLLSNGLTDRQIADALGVTIYTINKHVGAILQKMNVRSRTAAAVNAIREHIVPVTVALAVLVSEASRQA